MSVSNSSAGVPEGRPQLLLVIYSWDMLLAILGLFGALASFGGRVAIGAGEVDVPLALQILSALSAATYSAALIIIAVLLNRRLRWVRQAQMTVLAVAILLAAASLSAACVRGGVGAGMVLGNAAFVLADLVMLALMVNPGLRRWYTESGSMPAYVSGTILFWAATGATTTVLVALR